MGGGAKSVGVYISPTDITSVELTKRAGEYSLTQFVQQTIPAGTDLFAPSSIREDLPQLAADHSLFTQHLKESFKVENGIPMFFSFSPEIVVLRYFKILKIPKKEWEVAIRFEARKYLPLNLEKMNSDFIVLPIQKVDTELEVIFFAVDQAYAKRVALVLQEASLAPLSAEVSWLSILRLLQYNQPLKGKIKEGGILLSLEPERLGIALFVEGVPYFSREVRWPISTTAPTHLDLLDNIAGEVRLAQEFHRKNFPTKDLSTIFTFGTWVNDELEVTLTKECEIEVLKLDPFSRISGEKPATVSSSVVASMGVALRGLVHEPSGSLIYLAGSQTKKKKKVPVKLLLTVEAIFVCLILIGLQIYASSKVKKAQEAHDLVIKSRPVVTHLPNPLAPVKELSQIEKSYSRKVTFLRRAMDERVSLTSKVSFLAEKLPQAMWLQKLQWSETLPEDLRSQEREIKIVGAVYSEVQRDVEIINHFAEELKEGEFFYGLTEGEVVDLQRVHLGFHEVSQFEWAGSHNKKRKGRKEF